MQIRNPDPHDVPLILRFIKDLAAYEKLAQSVVATEESVRATIFGTPRAAEVVIAEEDGGTPVGFALFFHNYSTFLARPGLYLEDLFVVPEARGRGYGKALLAHLAAIARDRGCGRFEWSVLNWNTPAIEFYKSVGARPVDEWTVFRMTGEALDDLAVLSSPSPRPMRS